MKSSPLTAREMPPVVLVSPACIPDGLPQRLLARGFQRQKSDETWMVMEDLQSKTVPKIEATVEVRRIGRANAPLFAEVMVASYDMPAEWAAVLTDLIAPSIGAPGITHFLAFLGEKPIATLNPDALPKLCHHRQRRRPARASRRAHDLQHGR